MSRFEAALLTEFVQESLELLADLGTACGELSSSTEPNAQLATIDRGLHTIKGNAAALGFMQLSAASSKVLQAVRSEGHSGTPSASCLGRIWRFLVECRQYLMLVSNEKTPGDGFFTSADDGVTFAAEHPVTAPAVAIVLEANELSVEDILSSVPEINPDVRRLIPGAEAPPRLDGNSADPPRIEFKQPEREHGLTERAAALVETVSGFRRHLATTGVDVHVLGDVENFLRELSGDATDGARPIDEYLRGVIRDAEILAAALNLKIISKLEQSELRVLPALGHLLRHLLTELVHLRLVHISNGETAINWKISSSCENERLEICLSGLSKGNRTSALDRVRMQSSLEFLEDLEGTVRTEKSSLILSISMSGLRSQLCRVIQSADGRFCLSAECVRGAESDSIKPGTELVITGEAGKTRMRVDSIAPAQEMLVVRSSGKLIEEGILGFALSFAHSERIPLLDPDSI